MQLSSDLETNAFGESYLPAVNGQLFAERSARELFEQHLPAQFQAEDTCHLVIGSDSGLLLEHVRQQGVPEGSLYLFIEPPELESALLQSVRPSLSEGSGIALCRPDQWIAVSEPLGLETYILKKRIFLYPCLAARSTARDLYTPLLNRINAELDNKAYSAKLCLVDEPLIAQVMKNTADNTLPCTELKGVFAGQTALVMGAGPSLQDHIEWIKSHRERLVLFAASRLSRYLIDVDLIPDFIVSIDHQAVNHELSKAALKLPADVVLLNSNSVSSSLLGQWSGRHLYVGEQVPWHSDINTDNLQDRCGPTVTNTAVVVAGVLGFSRILLSGVDFCSPIGGRTHAVGEDLKEQQRRTHTVMTYSGDQATSNVQMVYAAKNLAEQVARLTECEVINLAPLAFRVDGIAHQRPEQITLETLPARDSGALVPVLDTERRRAQHQRLLQELNTTQHQLKQIQRLCDDAIAFNKKIYKRDKQGNYNLKARDKLDNIQRKLDGEFGHLAVIIKKVGMRFFIDAMTTRDINRFSDKQLERQGRRYYHAYRSATETLEAMLVDALQRTQSRLNEESPQPDIPALVEQWQRDGQPGRALLWQQRHPQAFDSLTEAERQHLAATQAQFADSLNPPELVGPRPNQFWRYRQKLTAYYTAGNLGQLQQVLDEIEHKCGQRPKAQPVLALGRAYRALLGGQRSLALEHLKQTQPQDRDDSLQQTFASLALEEGDLAAAEGALQQLAESADHFQPQYANLLKIRNKIPEAADQYTDYLQRHPEDIDTWLALAQLYREAEETELAKTVYTFVLEHDPGNTTARTFMNSQ